MEHTDDQLRRAYLEDEVARLQMEHRSLFAFSNDRRPSYGIVPDPEPSPADLTDDDVAEAITELAAERGIGITELSEWVLELTGGERDCVSRAQAVVELANMAEDELLGLTAKKVKDDDEDDEDLSDEDIDEDIEEMSEHMSEHQGHEGPRPKRAKRKRKPAPVKRGQRVAAEAASPEGGAGPSGAGEGGAMAASSPRRALVRAGDGSLMTVALSEDEEWAGSEVARLSAEHPDMCLSGPGAFDTPNDLGGPVKLFDFQVYDTGTNRDPSESVSDIDAEISRYLAEHAGMFGKEKPHSGNRKGKLAGRYPGTGPSGKPQTVGR